MLVGNSRSSLVLPQSDGVRNSLTRLAPGAKATNSDGRSSTRGRAISMACAAVGFTAAGKRVAARHKGLRHKHTRVAREAQETWLDLEELLPSSQMETRNVDTVLKPERPEFSALTLFRERNGWCPYSERVWLAMELKGLRFDTVLIDNMGSRPGWFGGQTPQVQWVPRERQGESLDIIRELEEKYPDAGPTLWPWEESVTDLVKAFKEIFPKRTRPSSRAAFLFDQSGPLWQSTFEATLQGADELLARHGGPFFYGERISVADIAWAPFLERYAAQLPCLHDGLRPYDPARWPRLAAWYEAMLTVPAYAARVCGDTISWRKVLAQAGYGNAGVVPDLQDEASQEVLGASGLDETKSKQLWQEYVEMCSNPEELAATPCEEVASRIVRNRQALIIDAMQYTSLAEGEADAGLLGLANLLREGGTAALSSTGDVDGSVRDIASYLDDRMCVPRDMGVLPGMELRKLAKELRSLS
mmetsp:Transcript_17629/g.31871  ORF Transcript_17629/g.31871 Transcript_17629/m.31871 type:complete len:473 (-) Transcript_17629:2-1420(-)